MRRLLLLLAALSSLTFLNIACIGCTHIEPGFVGVKVQSCSGGGVEPSPLGIGYHVTGPCSSIKEFPTYNQTLALGPEKNGEDDSIYVTTGKDSTGVGVAATLGFSVEGSKAPAIYSKFRMDLDAVTNGYVKQAVQNSLQRAVTDYAAEEFHGGSREKVRALAEKYLKDALKDDGFHVNQFTIKNVTPPTNVLAAINAKVAMVQTSAQAQAAVAKSEAEGRQRMAAAEADAKATRMRADAEAYANQKLASSLSPILVDYERTKKWDGKLPQVQGNGGSFINLPSAK